MAITLVRDTYHTVVYVGILRTGNLPYSQVPYVYSKEHIVTSDRETRNPKSQRPKARKAGVSFQIDCELAMMIGLLLLATSRTGENQLNWPDDSTVLRI